MKANFILAFVLLSGISIRNMSAVSMTTGPDTFAIHSIGHASLMFEYGNTIIHVDPYAAQANYDQYPDADVLLVTHAHTDHYDISAISKVKTDSTILICTQEVKNKNTYTGTIDVLANGDSTIVKNIPVKAVPAYNISVSFHAKGVGNGYIVTLGEKRIYIAGDTENIPEMDSLGKIDIAFLPMNLPYTMTPEIAANAAKRVKPDILYIYHFGNSDTARLRSLLSDQDIEIRMGKSVYYESAVRKQETPSSDRNIESHRIAAYPNPAGDHLTCHISVPLALISVYDLKGQLLLKNKLNGEGEHIIDLSPIASGVYILLMNDGRIETEEWLIIQK